MTSHRDADNWDRRELLTALLGSSFAGLAGGCRMEPPTFSGRLLAPNHSFGHRLRDGFLPPGKASKTQDAKCVIIGSGIAGLSSAWRLLEAGFSEFVVLELEDKPGGTSRPGQSNGFSFPWGAHYIPLPMAENRALIELLDQMGVLQSLAFDGTPVAKEEFLCREPEERLFVEGEWIQGLYPATKATDDDRRQLAEFRSELDRWVQQRDANGRRMFALPMSHGSDSTTVRELDNLSMAAWMDTHNWDSRPLRWLVDYACRDDYGLSLEQTSAWAGLFYFASRQRFPGEDSQPVITWPKGNGEIVEFLTGRIGSQLLTGHAACQVSSDSGNTEVLAYDISNEQPTNFRAERVIFAAPQFLATRLIKGHADERDVGNFRYSSWLVANVHLRERPRESSFPTSWDNVIYDSKSLGYVVSTHQSGRDHGPTVITWYYPFSSVAPSVSRQQLLDLDWKHWAEVALSDLETAHPDIRSLVTRVDCMRWGHAMIQPRVGFVWSEQRRRAATPYGNIHFAGTDLSGVALMEEAFYHGVRSAEEVLSSLGIAFDSML